MIHYKHSVEGQKRTETRGYEQNEDRCIRFDIGYLKGIDCSLSLPTEEPKNIIILHA